jgi:hypothetical protein
VRSKILKKKQKGLVAVSRPSTGFEKMRIYLMANLQTNAKLPEDLILKGIFPSFQITVACDSDIFCPPKQNITFKIQVILHV